MMANSFSGKTVFGKTVTSLAAVCRRAGMALGLVGLGLAFSMPPAQAETVIISTQGFAIGTPGFFLSVGNPVVICPPVVAYPGVVQFPAYPVYQTYPYYSVYPQYSQYPSYPIHVGSGNVLIIDDAVSNQVAQPGSVISTTPTVITNPTRYSLTSSDVVRYSDSDPIARFTSNTMPWLEVEDLSTTAGASNNAVSPSTQPTAGTTNYQISSPNPFNQSVRSLGQ